MRALVISNARCSIDREARMAKMQRERESYATFLSDIC
jgi:hypothetical protein